MTEKELKEDIMRDEKLQKMVEKATEKSLILKSMMILFFKYHDIKIDTINLDMHRGHTIYSYDHIPPKINSRFHDKFELGDMELTSVVKCENGSYIYSWERPQSNAEKMIDLWLNHSLHIHHFEPIMYIPKEE